MKRRRIVAVACTALLVGGAVEAAGARAQGAGLTGAGSTLVAPLEAQWAQHFQAAGNPGVTYGAVGSGTGIAQITARTVDFGASDAPLSAAQAAACKSCVQVPWALTATAIAFHINGITHINLTPSLISAIYQNQLVSWDSARIKKVNPGVKLPHLKITPVYRSDGSGDTYAFTDWLSRTNASWKSKIGFGTSVQWPQGVGGKGNDGVSAIEGSTNGAIAYISAAYVIAHSLKPAALQNQAGKFILPNLSNIKAAGAQVKKVPANNEMHIVNPPKSAKTAYPLSTFTYAIVPTTSPKAALLTKFISYAMTTGQQYGPALDFSPIPKVVLKADQSTLTKIHG